MNAAGATAVVTGGAGGLGLAFCRQLAALGAEVWALDNDSEALASAEREAHDPIRFLTCDVGNEAEVTAAVARIENESPGIDILVNNAAVLRDQTLVSKLGKRIKRHASDDWHATLASNLTGPFLMAREVAAAMIGRKRPGLIINLSSVVRSGNPGQSAYAACKAAIDALTVTWSQELAPYRIRVAALAPGFVETRLTGDIPPLFLERIREKTPLKRFGTLEEFQRALSFVIENEYFNGKVLELDGGLRF